MALNVPPAMTQAPAQGQQGQGNAAVSGVFSQQPLYGVCIVGTSPDDVHTADLGFTMS